MDNRKAVDWWLEAFRTRDLSKLLLGENFTHHSPYGTIRGRQAYLDLIRQNEEAFFSPVLEILDVFGEGEKYAIRYLMNQNPACDCIYVRDGLIQEIHAYYHVGKRPEL